MKKITRVLSANVRSYSRLGFYTQALFSAICFVGWKTLDPQPGLAIGALAVAAVIMTIRADRFDKAERILWVVIAFFLFAAETQSIMQDHNDSERKSRQEAALRQAQFDETVRRFNALISQNEVLTRQNRAAVERLRGILAEENSVKANLELTEKASKEEVCGRADTVINEARYDVEGYNRIFQAELSRAAHDRGVPLEGVHEFPDSDPAIAELRQEMNYYDLRYILRLQPDLRQLIDELRARTGESGPSPGYVDIWLSRQEFNNLGVGEMIKYVEGMRAKYCGKSVRQSIPMP